MTQEQLFELPHNQIKWVRSPRAKNLRITVRTDRTVVVTLPWRCSKEYAERYVHSKKAWIGNVFRKFDAIEQFQRDNPVEIQDLEQGQDRLFVRLKELAKEHGFAYRRATIRNQKTRWGSCSTQNNINLNINLIKLPAHLQDYVILHELVHTVHKNHSRSFWARLDEIVGGKSKQFRLEMRRYRTNMVPR